MHRTGSASPIASLLAAAAVAGAATLIPPQQALAGAPAPKGPAAAAAAAKAKGLPELLGGLRFRPIGPYRGGRVAAVAGVRGQREVFYFGGTGGGVWKTTNGGVTWAPVSDKDFRTGSVGALAVAESDPNVVYAGMGEAPIRGNVSHGDGVYRSDDAGRSWRNLGLADTHQISAVRVHPKDPDLVYVAAQGHVWDENAERGVYRSTDGGKSWKKVLFVDAKTGCSDLAMDPTNPRILYAGFWQVVRKPWTLESGGPGSSLYRSTDGGDTWTKLTKGLPEGTWGKVGVAASAARPGRVWALVEADKGGLYLSDDWGDSWKKVNDDNALRQRAWYYTEVFADPKAADTVYVLNVRFHKSVDGGKSFTTLRVPHGDNHDLWIDPDDPLRMVEGNDGGATVTFDGGATWSTVMNQPTAQFYRVATDDRFPYRVYGAQQDNSTVSIRSRSRGGSIGASDWYDVGGCESGWVAPLPKDPDVVFAGCYGGSVTRYDHRTGQEREITPWPQLAVGRAPRDLRYRFQWNAPILVSRHDPKVLWTAAQVLLQSTDQGQSWTEISPDLTRNEKEKQGPSGGPITKDNTGVEVYGTIFALAESPHEAGTLWAGSDDGLVHLTRDGGKTWKDVTPKGLPAGIQVNALEASPHEKGGAYLAATAYKLGDFSPYLYETTDFGATWRRIDAGIARDDFTRVVREDPERRGLLYAGTETGIWVSLDDGGRWTRLKANLPAVPVTDLAVKDGDLVVATQGRAFWILDDLSPLRQWSDAVAAEKLHVFAPRPAYRAESGPQDDAKDDAPRTAGKNPPSGATVFYWLAEKPKDDPKEKERVTVEVLEGEKVIRAFTSEKPAEEKKPEDEAREKPLEVKEGLNAFVWDLRLLKPTLVPKAVLWGSKEGPLVAPGTYAIRVTAPDGTRTVSLEVRPNPSLGTSEEDLKAQAALLADLRDRLSATHEAVLKLRDARSQVEALAGRAKAIGKGDGVDEAAKELGKRLLAVEEKLVNPKLKSEQDVLNFPPALDHQIVGLISAVGSAEARPTDAEVRYAAEVKATLGQVLGEADALLTKDVPAFGDSVRAKGIPPIVPLAHPPR